MRSLPDVIRLMSSRSSINWVYTRALRSMVRGLSRNRLRLSIPFAAPATIEDGVSGVRSSVRKGREELVPSAHAFGGGPGGALAFEHIVRSSLSNSRLRVFSSSAASARLRALMSSMTPMKRGDCPSDP